MAVRARGDEILVLNLVAYPGNTQSTDIAGRLCNGWADWMPDDVAFTLNRWCWRFSPERAAACQHVLFTHGGTVRVVARLTGIEGPHVFVDDNGKEQTRHSVRGHVLAAGDPVYDRWHGRQDIEGTMNRSEYNFIPATA
jgi:hypothetical protein